VDAGIIWNCITGRGESGLESDLPWGQLTMGI
jgi:hypothetical protein